MTDLQPDVTEILQEEAPDSGIIPVDIQGPIRTQNLPRKLAASRTVTFGDVTPKRLLRANPMRASANLVSFTSDMLVAFNRAAKEDPSTMARWPMNTPLLVTAATDVYVAPVTAPMTISVVAEYWAVGDGVE